ncbi:hypothetical protein [Saccharomonospora viridis]|uniref:hypothetical protein n=1 Tax=Saccharomonospora viridis TaxID=1852 RepID=UPI0024096A2C|nr:hypothetical protein [Saccharomonospora viridis]
MKRIPLWCWATLVGLGAFLWVFTPWENVSERARTAAQNLGATSVYAEPGAPDVVDPERAEKVIGDRAIVVAVFDETPLIEYADEQSPRQALCRDVASLVPTNLVVVFAANPDGDYNGSYCHGPEFPAPTLTDDTTDVFFLSLLATAEQSWQYRTSETDLVPQLEEFVLAFDTETFKAYGEVPRRGPVNSVYDVWQLVLACLAMVSATVVVFLLLRQLGRALFASRALRPREAGLNARLNRLADRVLHPEGGAPNAAAAKEYVLALREFHDTDRQRDRQRLDAVERRIEKIEGMLL